MKIVRYLREGSPRSGAVIGNHIADIADLFPEYARVIDIVRGGAQALEAIDAELATASASVALGDAHLLAPIEAPGKYLAIGMNYGKHAEEAGRLGVPKSHHQIWFNKQTSCLAGPSDEIDPGVTEKLDYEVELGVVIGKAAKCVSEAVAREHVFGYFVANDVSARDWQFHSQTITVGKSFDTHGPIGPWIVTADEIPDPHALGLRCFVNGALRQSGSTADMIANIWTQIAYLSTAFTLDPGDLLATGTPEGVGVGMTPPVFLQPHDVIRCEIDGIGMIENRVSGSSSLLPR